MGNTIENTLTINELRKLLQDKGNGKNYSDWTEYLPRLFSIYFTNFFIKAGISANTITFLSIIFGLLTALLIATGNPLFIFIGCFTIFLDTILDCSDGEVARYNRSNSNTGEYFDRIASAIVDPIILFSISIMIFNQMNNIFIIILGFFAAISLLLMRLAIAYSYVCSFGNFLTNAKSKNVSEIRLNDAVSRISMENIVKKPKIIESFSPANFISELFFIKSWGLIYWIWAVGIIAILSTVQCIAINLSVFFIPLLLLYSFVGPVGVAYVIYTTIKNKIPDTMI